MFNLAAFLLYVFITAYTPGPNNILSMSHAARLGLSRSYPFNLGMFCGLLTVMCLCALFSTALFALAPKIAPPMKIIGAAYMLYLAAKTYRSALNPTASGHAATFKAGLFLQFVNIKIMIYGVTSMSVYILPHFTALAQALGFALLLALICFSANLCWALFGSLFYRLFKQHQKAINTVMALSLAYCAVALFM